MTPHPRKIIGSRSLLDSGSGVASAVRRETEVCGEFAVGGFLILGYFVRKSSYEATIGALNGDFDLKCLGADNQVCIVLKERERV